MGFRDTRTKAATAVLALGALAALALLTGAAGNAEGGADNGAQLRVRLPHFTRYALPDAVAVPAAPVSGLAATGSDRGSALALAKPLRIGGREIAAMPIAIDTASRMTLPAGPLAAALERAGRDRSMLAGRDPDAGVALNDLAAAGLPIRFDPASDSLVLD